MTSTRYTYTHKKFSPYRKASVDLLHAANRKHMTHALVEVDISDIREAVRKIRQKEKAYLSLIGYLVYCAAKEVEVNPWMHAYRDWRNRLVAFDEVDVSTTIERKIAGQTEVIPKIIRRANRKDIFEISAEIREAKSEKLKENEVYRSVRWYVAIPTIILRLFFRVLDRRPKLMKEKAGTIMVTSGSPVGQASAWGIPVASHTLNLTIGGISHKVIERDRRLESREHLCLTVSFDHAIVDGAPASRFVRQLLTRIKSGLPC